jgi:hypothetical protein
MLDFLAKIKRVLTFHGYKNVLYEYELAPVCELRDDFYLVLGIDELKTSDAVSALDGGYYPTSFKVKITMLANPKLSTVQILYHFENFALSPLLSAGALGTFKILPLTHDKQLNKLKVTLEFDYKGAFKS